MATSVKAIKNFEKQNTCLDILKSWYRVDNERDVIKELNNKTDAFIPDTAYSAGISKRQAIENLVDNFYSHVDFKVTGIDLNTGCPESCITVNALNTVLTGSTRTKTNSQMHGWRRLQPYKIRL